MTGEGRSRRTVREPGPGAESPAGPSRTCLRPRKRYKAPKSFPLKQAGRVMLGLALLLGVGAGVWYLRAHSPNRLYWRAFLEMNIWLANQPLGDSNVKVRPKYDQLPIEGVTDERLLEIHRLYGESLDIPKPEYLLDLLNENPALMGSEDLEQLVAERKARWDAYQSLVQPKYQRISELINECFEAYGDEGIKRAKE